MEIYIVRHGRTKWNSEKRLQGSADIELTEEGIAIAHESGLNLKDVRFDKVYSSPLKRAYRTAVEFNCTHDVEIKIDNRLREISFGDFEGCTQDELIKKPGCTFKYFFDEPLKYMAEENGETFEELCARAKDFIVSEIEPLAKNPDIERVMIVGHGAINKAMMCHILNHGIDMFWSGGLQRNCNVMIIKYEDGVYKLIDDSKIFYTPSGSN